MLHPSIVSLVLAFSLRLASAAVGDLDATLKHCCNLGRKEESCSSISTPRDVPSEHLSMCLTAIEICCVEAERAKQCSLGQQDARDGQDCVGLPGVSTRYRKDCCSACRLGLIVSSMTLACANHEFLFGPPWNVAYMTCCSSQPYTGRLASAPTLTQPIQKIGIGLNDLGSDSEEADNFCDQFPGQLCQHICIPTRGSYECECRTGFTLDTDGKSCILLPENDRCRSNNPCSQKCVDTGIAIECSCQSGYTLAADKKNCNDIDECASDSNACKLAGMECRNEAGSFVCLTPDGSIMQPGTLQSSPGNGDDLSQEETGGKVPESKCPEGYALSPTTFLCDDLDECIANKKICPRNTTCMNTVGSFFCENVSKEKQCAPGLQINPETKECEDVNECLEGLDDCREQNLKCLNTMGSFICHKQASWRCPAGFKYSTTLQQCLDVDECAEKIHSCQEEIETCVNTDGAYECIPINGEKCSQGFVFNETISTCIDVDECALGLDDCDPVMESCRNTYGGFNCTAKRTQRPFSWAPTPAPTRTTTTTVTAPIFQDCQAGFKFESNSGRCVDIDECVESRIPVCDSSQNCFNNMGSYRCVCKRGFEKDPNTLACVDINECHLELHDCTVGQRCDNTIGSYKCFRLTSCGTGYTLNAQTGECEDDNECLLKSNNCARLGSRYQCKNTPGSFRCVLKTCEGRKVLNLAGECVDQVCQTGFESSPTGVCTDLNECLSNPCRENEKCVNTPGSYYCSRKLDCGHGFEMNPQGTQCVDVDECTRGTHSCSRGQQCFNRIGSYSCQCPQGYLVNQVTKECIDIDECTSFGNNRQLCASNSVCQNLQGSYRCNCKEGFKNENDDKVCVDINECDMGPGLCQHNCFNTWGSYRCSCNSGYVLQPDGRSCYDIDECEQFKDRNLCVGICQNTPGSYTCRCPEGYRLGSDDRTCIDIDECASNTGICRSDQVCLNTRGGHQCNSVYCPSGYSRETEHKNRCKKNSLYCHKDDLECMKEPQTISNNYMTFVSNIAIPPVGYLDLFTMRGPMWQSTAVRFDLKMVSARAPPHVPAVEKEFFRIRRQSHNQAIISLVRPIKGPQQIELHLTMEILHNGSFSGTVLAKLFIVVSDYEF
ncbi:fibrillin-2 [Cloeon dipterum]|uniref:fibrillin-2 n=1 Tax=Cloeon dipterum TaxID=197152 RepID=UPI00321FA12D